MLRIAKPLVAVLLLVPIVLGLLVSIAPAFGYLPAIGSDRLSLQYWHELLAVPGITRSMLLSLLAGLLTPLISLALVLCFLATASGSRLDVWMRRLLSPILSVPHAAAAFGLAFLIAPSGFLMRLIAPLAGWERAPDLLIVNDSWGVSMMTALVLKETPFLLLMALAALPQLQVPQRIRIARSLGYSPATGWLKCVAPLLYPMLRLPLFAIIAFASSNVDVALILGPGLPPTLSVRLLEWYSDADLSRRLLAGAAALLQLGISVLAIALWIAGEKLVRLLHQRWLHSGARAAGETGIRILGRGGVGLTVLLVSISLLLLLVNSISGLWPFPDLMPNDWTLRDWQAALPGLGSPLLNTLKIAVLSTVLSITLVIACLEAEFRRPGGQSSWWLLYVPLLLPQVVFLFGLVTLAESLGLQPGLVTVAFGHLLFVLPYVYLSLSEAYRRLDPRWQRIGASLGASRWAVFWRLRLPLVLAPLLTAAALGLAISISLYLPTQLLGAGRINTVTTEAVALASGGSASIIAVWAVAQALLPLFGFSIALFLPRLVWRKRQGMQENSRA